MYFAGALCITIDIFKLPFEGSVQGPKEQGTGDFFQNGASLPSCTFATIPEGQRRIINEGTHWMSS